MRALHIGGRGKLVCGVCLAALVLAAAPATATAQKGAAPVVFKNQANAPLRVEVLSIVDGDGNTVAVNTPWYFPADFSGQLMTSQGKLYARVVHYRVIGPKGSSYWTKNFGLPDNAGNFVVTFSADNYNEHVRVAGGNPAPVVVFNQPPPVVVTKKDNSGRLAQLNAEIAESSRAISQYQQDVTNWNNGIVATQASLFLLRQRRQDPNLTDAQRFGIDLLIAGAQALLSEQTTNRNSAQFNLNTERARYNRLLSERDTLLRE